MSKEQSPIDLKDPSNPILMRQLLRSFGDESWNTCAEYHIDTDQKFGLWRESGSGAKVIEYLDRDVNKGRHAEFTLYSKVMGGDGYSTNFVFRQVARGNRVENHIFVYPYRGFISKQGGGIHYGPDGNMTPLYNFKGLPRKIDMDATVTAFLEQVIAGKFGRPKLIKPQRK